MPAPCGPLWTPVSGASLSPGKGAQGCSRSRTCSDKRPSADIGPTLFGTFFFTQPAPPAFDIGTLQLDRNGAATGQLERITSFPCEPAKTATRPSHSTHTSAPCGIPPCTSPVSFRLLKTRVQNCTS